MMSARTSAPRVVASARVPSPRVSSVAARPRKVHPCLILSNRRYNKSAWTTQVEFNTGEMAQKVTAAVLAGFMIAAPVIAAEESKADKAGICASNPTARICLKDSASG